MRPAIRYGRTIVFPGGQVRQLRPLEYVAVRLGLKRTVRQ